METSAQHLCIVGMKSVCHQLYVRASLVWSPRMQALHWWPEKLCKTNRPGGRCRANEQQMPVLVIIVQFVTPCQAQPAPSSSSRGRGVVLLLSGPTHLGNAILSSPRYATPLPSPSPLLLPPWWAWKVLTGSLGACRPHLTWPASSPLLLIVLNRIHWGLCIVFSVLFATLIALTGRKVG